MSEKLPVFTRSFPIEDLAFNTDFLILRELANRGLVSIELAGTTPRASVYHSGLALINVNIIGPQDDQNRWRVNLLLNDLDVLTSRNVAATYTVYRHRDSIFCAFPAQFTDRGNSCFSEGELARLDALTAQLTLQGTVDECRFLDISRHNTKKLSGTRF